MPYTVSELEKDGRFKGMPKHAIEIFVNAFNAALKQYNGDETKAFATAWAAVKHKYRKQADGTWMPFSAGKEGDMPEEALIERDARLFEAGIYEDKGLEVTESDLDTIIANTSEAPIKVEHGDSPFDGALGVARGLYRKGKELWGKLAFKPAAWTLIDAANARKLSVAIKRDKTGIAEVSLVRNPRVAGAQVFDDRIELEGGEVSPGSGDNELAFARELLALVGKGGAHQPTEKRGDNIMAENTEKNNEISFNEAMREMQRFANSNPDAQAVYEANRALIEMAQESQEEVRKVGAAARASMQAIQQANTDILIERMKREGKIVPAIEEFARAILRNRPLKGMDYGAAETVHFRMEKDGEPVDVSAHYADAFVAFLEGMPKIIDFEEIAKAQQTETVPEGALEMFKKFGIDPNSAAAKQALAEMRR